MDGARGLDRIERPPGCRINPPAGNCFYSDAVQFDDLLIIRYQFGLRGDSLIANAVAPNATRKTSNAIEDYLGTLP